MLLLTLLLTLYLVAGGSRAVPASKQFRLDPQISASSCFYLCHLQVSSIIPLTGKTMNSGLFITLNCKEEAWAAAVAACLPVTCTSAPDVAYAVEYAASFCARGGVPDVQLKLPDWYLQTPGGGYYNSTLVRRHANHEHPDHEANAATRAAPRMYTSFAPAIALFLLL